MTRGFSSIALAVVVLAAACERPAEEAASEPEPEVTTPADLGPALPDTTGEAVWAWLEEERYAESWELWPGTRPLYPGTDPHGAVLTTYVNAPAREALRNGDESMPPGAVIVKENYMPDSTLAAVTVMLLVDGYDPQHQNWYWAKFGSAGEIDAAGRVEGCIGCHGQQPDYLFTGDLGTVAPADSIIG